MKVAPRVDRIGVAEGCGMAPGLRRGDGKGGQCRSDCGVAVQAPPRRENIKRADMPVTRTGSPSRTGGRYRQPSTVVRA